MPLETELNVEEMREIAGWLWENSKEMEPGDRRMVSQLWMMTSEIVRRLDRIEAARSEAKVSLWGRIKNYFRWRSSDS